MRWVMERCDAVVTISEAARETLATKFPEIEVCVVPNGVDDVLFSPEKREVARRDLGLDDSALHVITVGRLTQVKRFDTLVAALAALAARGHRVRGWVVGDGELRGEIERSVAESPSLAGRVTCLGPRPQDEVARWIAAADVFVLTSAGETGGNVVLEAMSAGLPVVSTPVGWAADFISSGRNGIIVPIGDVDALVRELDSLLADAGRRRELGRAARRTIEERGLNWQGCARNYIGRYRELLESAS
jgi:UDP-glucose:(heptosyl)LPS alpha-1,3-glucosyltransferase